ncbi:MAG: oligopeptidase B, partial [Dehalococcoidia bacterium]
MTAPLEPPRALRRPTVLRHADRERVDDYYWMRERDDPEVLAYLKAENEYVTTALARLDPLRQAIFTEIKTRVRETDVSAPSPWGEWEYFSRTIAGMEYTVHCRRPRSDGALPDADAVPGATPGEQVLLDENELAADASYFALRGLAISPNHTILAYSADLTGGERATLRFRNLDTGTTLVDEVP